ncbi:MAG: homoserine O-acetyltransferase/O-succinyltransferase family protein [Hyphomicrobiales bacterium]
MPTGSTSSITSRYDSTTLAEEHERDVASGTPIDVPHNYYPGDDPACTPLNRWRSHAFLLFGNWINQVYPDYLVRSRRDRP